MRWLIKLIGRLFGAVGSLANSAARKLFEEVKKVFETAKKLFWKIIGFVKSNMRRAITTTIVLGLLTTALTLFYFFNTWLTLLFVCVIFIAATIYAVFCFTIVPDGRAKRVDRMGAYRHIILQWNGHSLDPNGNVTNVPAPRSFLGGFRWVSWLKPLGIDRIYITPEFKYNKIELIEGKQVVKPHTLVNLDYILVRPDVFGVMVRKEETSAATGERIPIDVMLAVGLRVVNPEKTLTQAPTNWWEKTDARFVSMTRGWIAATSLDDILSVKGTSNAMMAIINQLDASFLLGLDQDWGLKIEKIELADVDLPEDYQQAAGIKRKQEWEAGGLAAATAGAELAMVSSMSGIPLKDLQEKIKAGIEAAVQADPVHGLENWVKANPKYWDLIQKKQLGIRPILFGNADGSPLDPLTASIAALITLAKSAGGGGTGGGGTGGGGTPDSGRIKGFAGGAGSPDRWKAIKPKDMTEDDWDKIEREMDERDESD